MRGWIKIDLEGNGKLTLGSGGGSSNLDRPRKSAFLEKNVQIVHKAPLQRGGGGCVGWYG